MVYNLSFFSSNCSLFHNSNVFGSCIIHILYTGRAKIKKNNSGAKRLKAELILNQLTRFNKISAVSSEKGKGSRIVTTATFD